MSAFFMETTRISSDRTVSEIQQVLSVNGADSILIEYASRQPEAISFKVTIEGRPIPFRLPCRWKKLEASLKKKGARCKSDDTWEIFSRRVAWRQILRWIEAQMALVQTEMVNIEEVFLPYAQNELGQTVFEHISHKGFLLLGNSQGA